MAPTAARRAAASALRFLADAAPTPPSAVVVGHTSDLSRSAARFSSAATRLSATPAAHRSAAPGARFSTGAHNVASFFATPAAPTSTTPGARFSNAALSVSFSATPAATAYIAAAQIRRTARPFSSVAGRSTARVAKSPFKLYRRLKHSRADDQKNTIPDEVLAEINRIDAEGLRRHQELVQAIRRLTNVADSSLNAKRMKVDCTWEMGKTAFRVCSMVLAGAAASGYIVLNLVKGGWAKDNKDAAGTLLEKELTTLKEDVNSKMDKVMEEKEREEAAGSDKISRALDVREAAIAAREAAVAAKEAELAVKKN